MKKLLGIVVLGLLWCNVGFADDLGEFSKFFKKKKTWIGRPTFAVVSANPISISFLYQAEFVSDFELAAAAEYHCAKHGKFPIQVSDELYAEPKDFKVVFECKN